MPFFSRPRFPFVGCIAGSANGDNAGQSVAWSGLSSANVVTAAAFDNAPVTDSDGFWQGDGTFVVPAGKGGRYQVTAGLSIDTTDWKGATGAAAGVEVLVNGSPPTGYAIDGQQLPPGASFGTGRSAAPDAAGLLDLAAGDVVSLRAIAYTYDPNPPPDGYPVTFEVFVDQFSLVRVSGSAADAAALPRLPAQWAVDDDGGLVLSYEDTQGIVPAIKVTYIGDPTDYIPLLAIGDGSVDEQVFTIDSSGDSDFSLRDSNTSTKWTDKTDGGFGQVAKIGQSSSYIGKTPTLNAAYGTSIYISAGASVFFQVLASGALLLPGLPTADPHVADQLWNSAGTLKVSAG